jgi:hypothetical protein
MKITYERLFEVIDVLNNTRLDNKESKFGYVIGKNTPKLQKILAKHNEKMFDIDLENAQVDEKTGSILKDTKGEFLFTKEAAIKKEAEKRLIKHEEIDFEPYVLQELTESLYRKLGTASCDVFSGIFLDPKQVEEANKNEAWNSPIEEVKVDSK